MNILENALTTGIPQSADAPQEALGVFGSNPWDQEEEVFNEELSKWYSAGLDKVYSMALDPDAAFKDEDLSFDVDPKRAQMLAINDAFLELNRGDFDPDIPLEDGPDRGLLRVQLAERHFSGKGAESEEAFFGEITKQAGKRKEEKEFYAALQMKAGNDAQLPAEERKGLAGILREMKGVTGYDAGKQADYADAIVEVSAEMAERIEPFKDTLELAWRSFTNKVFIPREKLAEIEDEDWESFLIALRFRAQALPDKERETFLVGMQKDLMRSLETFGRQAGETVDDYALTTQGTGEVFDYAERPSEETMRQSQAARNRAHEVRRILNAEFDPIDYVKGLGWLQKAPGVTATSLSMAVPGIGAATMAASMQGAAQESLYLKFRDKGVSEGDAGLYSSALAPAVMLPQMALEKAGFSIWARKAPWLSKALDAAGDKITNRALRFAAKTAAITAAEGTIEVTQDFTESAVQDLAAALQPQIPGVDLSEEFKAAWAQFPEIAGSMLVLSLFGAAGGMNREAQAAAWAEATPRQMRAAGLKPEMIEAIEQAKASGPSSLTAAVDEAWKTRDANTPEAKQAAEEEAAEAREIAKAAEEAKASGMMPDIIQRKAADGTITYEVFDNLSKESIGTAPSISGAMRIAQKHSAAFDEMGAERTAYLASALESGEAALQVDEQGVGENRFETGTLMTAAMAAAENPDSIDQFHKQSQIKEQISGGTGDVTRVALGQHKTELRAGVRHAVNRLFKGSSVLTVFHETWHGLWRKAQHNQAISRDEALEFVRSVQQAVGEGKLKRGVMKGEGLGFLPADFDSLSVEDQNTAIDEALSEIAEMEILRTRKRDKDGKPIRIGKGIINRNLNALMRLAPGATKKFRALIEAARGIMGLASARALAMKKAIREGRINEAEYEAFLDKMTGRDLQAEHDGMVRDEHAAILGDEAITDDAPFSLGRSTVTPTASTRVFPGAEGSPTVIGPAAFSIRAFHGTPHKIDPREGFKTEKIGTGEGAQAYGYGLYFAGAIEVADGYRKALGRTIARYSGKDFNPSNAPEFVQSILDSVPQDWPNQIKRELRPLIEDAWQSLAGSALRPPAADAFAYARGMIGAYLQRNNVAQEKRDEVAQWISALEQSIEEVNTGEGGNLYTVRIKPEADEFLDWDKPLSEQSEKVRDMMKAAAELGDKMANVAYAAMIKATDAFEDWNGSRLYSEYAKKGTQPQQATAVLLAAGIRGIRYLDGNSRGDGEGSYNYVIFDEADIEIVEENGTPVNLTQAQPSYALGRVTPEQDAAYLQAVESGDMETAQRMVDAAARDAGYDSSHPLWRGDSQTWSVPTGAVYLAEDKHLAEYFRRQHARRKEAWGELDTTVVRRFYAKTGMRLANEETIIKGKPLRTTSYLHAPYTRQESVGDTITATDLLAEGYDGARGEMSGGDYGDTEILVIAPSNIKSADPVTYDDNGNVIPLSQRFNTASDNINYALAPASFIDSLSVNASARVKDPRVKAAMFTRMLNNLAELKRDRDEFGVAFGKDYKRKAIEDPRKRASIRKEGAMREALRREELEEQAHARHGGILHDDDMGKLWSMPTWAAIADPANNLKGRIMSLAAWKRRNPGESLGGEYDGSGDIPRVAFGGQNAPDQIAQELYENGLLPSPTADALWDALRREAASVGKIKETMGKAREDVANAKKQAKEEAAAWVKERLKEEAANYSPRQRLLRALAMLDAILSVLPAEVRGKIGGYTQLAKLGSDEARLKFLNERIAKADEVLDRYVKAEYTKMLNKLFERAKPVKGKPGEKPKGKAGADVHALFDKLREIRAWNAADAQAYHDALMQIVASGEMDNGKGGKRAITPEEEAHMTLEANLALQIGDWKNADASRAVDAYNNALSVFEAGYAKFRLAKLLEKEDRDIRRENLKAEVGNKPDLEARQEAHDRDNGRIGWARKSGWSLRSFADVIEGLFGRNSVEGTRIVDMERAAAYQAEDANQADLDEVNDLLRMLSGGKSDFDGWKLRHAMAEETITATNPMTGGKLKFSQFQAVDILLLWRRGQGRQHMLGPKDENGQPTEWHYNQAFVDEVEKQLTPEARVWMNFLSDKYLGEWDITNPTFEKLQGIRLSRDPAYYPISAKPLNDKGTDMLDPVTGLSMAPGSGSPGFLKAINLNAVAEPEFQDSLQKYLTHRRQLNHWLAYAPMMAEIGPMLGNRKLMNHLEAKGGEEGANMLRAWLNHFVQGGNRDAAARHWMSRMIQQSLDRLSGAILIGRASVLAIQSLQLGAAMAEMKLSEYVPRLAKLLMSPDGWAMWKAAYASPFIRRRVESMPPALRAHHNQLLKATPTRIRHWQSRLGETIAGADGVFTAGTYAIIFDQRKSTLRKQFPNATAAEIEAMAHKEAERITERVAQPVRTGTRSMQENQAGVAMRTIWNFASEPRQKVMLAGLRMLNPEYTAAEKARTMLLVWGVGGVGASILRAVMRDMRDDGEDDEIFDEKNWDWKRLAMDSALGPFQGIPFVGDVIEGTSYAVAGEYHQDGGMFSAIPKAAVSVMKIKDSDDAGEVLRHVESILTGAAAFNDNAAAASSFSHALRDAFGVIQNVTPD